MINAIELEQTQPATSAFRWPQVFLAITLPLALALAVLTPPFQAADEPAHFNRAYSLSEGHVLPERIGNVGGGRIPASIEQVTHLADALAGRPDRTADWAQIRAAFDRPLNPDVRVDAQFPGSAAYFPLVYVPQAAGITVGRWLGFGPLALLYWGRLFTALAAVALFWFAIRLTPIHARAFGLLALIPMVAFQRSSVSADAVTMGVAVLFTALVLRAAGGDNARISWRDLAILAVVGIALALTKQTYGILGLLLFIIDPGKLGGRLRAYSISSGILALMLIATGTWSAFASTLFVPRGMEGVGVSAQLAFFKEEPLRATRVLLKHLWTNRGDHLWNAFGGLGWLDAHIPMWSVWCLLILLGSVAVLDGGSARIRLSHRLLVLGAALLGALSIVTILYFVWTPARSPIVEGVQGRYFLPLFPLLLVALYTPRLGRLRLAPLAQNVASGGFVVIALGVTVWTVVRRYWIGS